MTEPTLGPRAAQVLAILDAAARAGAVCPGNAAIGQMIGASDLVASRCVGELRDLGFVEVRMTAGRQGRVVTIVAGGHATVRGFEKTGAGPAPPEVDFAARMGGLRYDDDPRADTEYPVMGHPRFHPPRAPDVSWCSM